MEPTNPYAAPAAPSDVPPLDDVTLRREHLGAEWNIRFVGLALYGLVALSAFLRLVWTPMKLGVTELLISLPAFGISTAILVALGRSIRGFSPVARLILSGWTAYVVYIAGWYTADLILALCFIALGCMLLFVLWSPKANVVFSHHYRNVVMPATKHVKVYETW